MAREITLIFPHQLFENHPGLRKTRPVYLVEDSLFFGDHRYPVLFHKHKLMLHIAAMQHYRELLQTRGYTVKLVHYRKGTATRGIGDVLAELRAGREAITAVHLCHVTDDVLERRILRVSRDTGLVIHWYETPQFLSPREWLREQLVEGNGAAGISSPGAAVSPRPPRMQQFYIAQRKRLGILLAGDAAGEHPAGARPDGGGRRNGDRPVGGRWSFDTENRKPWPARHEPPPDPAAAWTDAVRAAATRVDKEFPDNPGTTTTFWYPVTHAAAREWFLQFLEERFPLFGPYEDAICSTATVLYHSVLSPLLNIGLVTPREILEMLDRRYHLDSTASPGLLAGLEGFVRQIVGWREYVRGVYIHYGVRQRTTNAWSHHRPLPGAFYRATTGVLPVDTVIRRVTERSYCHHIERLMVVGNILMLCEIHPDQVYQWFTELFIDAYDWVMVPNVYGMSQFSDGGLLATKPYISGANYIRKMSNYPRGEWEGTWTALFWRFLDRHREFFAGQPRMNMLVKQLDKDTARTRAHHQRAERFLESIF